MRSILALHVATASRLITSATTASASATTAVRHFQIDSTLTESEASSSTHVCNGSFGRGSFASSSFGGPSDFPDVPQLCATPKKKLTLYRRGNRRVWYWLKRKEECAKCTFCGAISGRNHMFSGAAGNSLCTGQCVQQPNEGIKYPDEYRPPC